MVVRSQPSHPSLSLHSTSNCFAGLPLKFYTAGIAVLMEFAALPGTRNHLYFLGGSFTTYSNSSIDLMRYRLLPWSTQIYNRPRSCHAAIVDTLSRCLYIYVFPVNGPVDLHRSDQEREEGSIKINNTYSIAITTTRGACAIQYTRYLILSIRQSMLKGTYHQTRSFPPDTIITYLPSQQLPPRLLKQKGCLARPPTQRDGKKTLQV